MAEWFELESPEDHGRFLNLDNVIVVWFGRDDKALLWFVGESDGDETHLRGADVPRLRARLRRLAHPAASYEQLRPLDEETQDATVAVEGVRASRFGADVGIGWYRVDVGLSKREHAALQELADVHTDGSLSQYIRELILDEEE